MDRFSKNLEETAPWQDSESLFRECSICDAQFDHKQNMQAMAMSTQRRLKGLI